MTLQQAVDAAKKDGNTKARDQIYGYRWRKIDNIVNDIETPWDNWEYDGEFIYREDVSCYLVGQVAA